MIIEQHIYRKAFQNYLRTGAPIMRSIKQDRPTTHYIWRTRRDNRVRSVHADREGQVFSWDNPPEGGHPGEDYGCRCTAEPYVPEVSESMRLIMMGVSDTGRRWGNSDFTNHYWNGNGTSVRVRDTGNLRAIVNEYQRIVERNLLGQIADEARENIDHSFQDSFRNVYPMQSTVFSLGDTTIGGIFRGKSNSEKGVLQIQADLSFFLYDEFADPIDLGVELPGGTPYPIKDYWEGQVNGIVLIDRTISSYKYD